MSVNINSHNSSSHEGNSLLMCNICGKNFANLNDHKISVHDERKKPFNVVAINVCGIECNGRPEEIPK